MSAWLVSNYHVNALATFAVDQGLTNRPAEEVALDLWRENRESLRYRYDDADKFWGLPLLERDFKFEDVTLPSVWYVLKGAQCYDYQACEHPGYKTSAAKALADAIETRALELLELPSVDAAYKRREYNDAPWGLDDPRVEA